MRPVRPFRALAALGFVALLAASVPAMPVIGARAPDDPFTRGRVPGQLLVLLRDATENAPALRLNPFDTLTYLPTTRAYALAVAPDAEREAYARLLADPRVASVEPNARFRAARIPNDPGYPMQAWPRAVNLEAAWDVTTGAIAATIAVVDTGVDASHPDLAGRVLPGYDSIGGTGETSDRAPNRHGTSVALLAAGRGDNGAGGAGVAWGARVLPVRALDANGDGTTQSVAGGVRWAVEHGATVINLSTTAEGTGFSRVLSHQIAYARDRNVVVVVAAGVGSVAAYAENDATTITVGAADANGAVADFSRRPKLDVLAPGVGLPVALASGTISATGSSFAAPIVAGSIALMQSVRPDLRPDDARAILTRTARPAAGGAGLLDVRAAVREAQLMPSPLPALPTPAYRAIYERTDAPIAAGTAGTAGGTTRGYLWGPEPLGTIWEPYAEAPGGRRQVWYFDKGRLELTDPASGTATSGLLVTEMVTGRVQTGRAQFEGRDPAAVPLVGDLDTARAVTYAALIRPRALPPRPIGTPVTEQLTANGTTTPAPQMMPDSVTTGPLVAETNHAVASVFAVYLASTGPVRSGGQITNERLFDPPYFLVGLPITEAYWVTATVGGRERRVLVQAFERRVLTYTPDNPDGFRVEMGNVGLHYLAWRYGTQ